MEREAFWDPRACAGGLRKISESRGTRLTLCGMCIAACPYVRAWLRREGAWHPAGDPGSFTIRPFRPEDTPSVISLFRSTVLTVNLGHYSSEQVAAWSSLERSPEQWTRALLDGATFIADRQGRVIGAAELKLAEARIGCFYVHRDYQRCGIGSRLLGAVVARAVSENLRTLSTESSITARPFFEQHGFHVVKAQEVEVKGVSMPNFVMTRRLYVSTTVRCALSKPSAIGRHGQGIVGHPESV